MGVNGVGRLGELFVSFKVWDERVVGNEIKGGDFISVFGVGFV